MSLTHVLKNKQDVTEAAILNIIIISCLQHVMFKVTNVH